nr:hypothetical protein [Tanacetum cinerariifolium]
RVPKSRLFPLSVEEILHQRGALVGQHAATHLRARVQQAGAMPPVAHLGLIGPVDNLPHLRPGAGPGAHHARLD